ncbi:lactate utilization protein C [Virgibacillus kekensis]|uniref:Lactate utilization protein C n=1 Tax=Virgibacillus kekensis TaxID=202261 RepID=A0ABV9DHA0_9BACI
MPKGEIVNRETFLDNIASNLGRARRTNEVVRPDWNNQMQWKVLSDHTVDELVDVLEKQCKSIHTDLYRTTQAELGSVLAKVVEAYGGKTVVTSMDTRFDEYQLTEEFTSWDGIAIEQWDSTRPEASIRLAERADVGITFSDITLAESGTVILFSDEGKGRSVSLLPSTYIAVIPKSTIVPRLTQATRRIHQRVEAGEGVPTCINFISGPSNSADIEMNLVVGVHGPIKTTYIVVDDQ